MHRIAYLSIYALAEHIVYMKINDNKLLFSVKNIFICSISIQ